MLLIIRQWRSSPYPSCWSCSTTSFSPFSSSSLSFVSLQRLPRTYRLWWWPSWWWWSLVFIAHLYLEISSTSATCKGEGRRRSGLEGMLEFKFDQKMFDHDFENHLLIFWHEIDWSILKSQLFLHIFRSSITIKLLQNWQVKGNWLDDFPIGKSLYLNLKCHVWRRTRYRQILMFECNKKYCSLGPCAFFCLQTIYELV